MRAKCDKNEWLRPAAFQLPLTVRVVSTGFGATFHGSCIKCSSIQKRHRVTALLSSESRNPEGC